MTPERGEVWDVDLDPARGHEQAGRRPCAILSVNAFNESPAGLVIVLPITSRPKAVRSHVRVPPPEGGLSLVSFVKTEDVRSVSIERLAARRGRLSDATMARIEEVLRILLGL